MLKSAMTGSDGLLHTIGIRPTIALTEALLAE